ncbi:MAG: hypothetical protein ACI9FD_002838 [Gammaproteobacteria bacterium]
MIASLSPNSWQDNAIFLGVYMRQYIGTIIEVEAEINYFGYSRSEAQGELTVTSHHWNPWFVYITTLAGHNQGVLFEIGKSWSISGS